MHEDPYHCNCFVINPQNSEFLRTQLLVNRFFNPFQENHGQTFGLAKNIDGTLQFHIKTMPNGKIEAEIEPQTQYVEHLNKENRSTEHNYVKEVLDKLKIPYRQITSSFTCLSAQIKRPSKTTSVVGAALGVLIVVGLLAILSKK